MKHRCTEGTQQEQIVYPRDKPHASRNIWYTQKQNILFSQPETCPQQGYNTVGMSFFLGNRDRTRCEHSSAAETARALKCGTRDAHNSNSPWGLCGLVSNREGKEWLEFWKRSNAGLKECVALKAAFSLHHLSFLENIIHTQTPIFRFLTFKSKSGLK